MERKDTIHAGAVVRDGAAFGIYPETPWPGDANNDGVVNVGDLGIVAANWNNTNGPVWVMGNFNGDGVVDVGDLGVLAGNWGWTGAPAPPCPSRPAWC